MVTRLSIDKHHPQPSRVTRASNFIRWQPDKWTRLNILAQLVGSAQNVLDVGGRGHELASLLPGVKVISANIRPPADCLVKGERLPFPDNSFEVVTSSDVLEHLPRASRQEHVDDLARVARSRLVIGCPLGSAELEASEERIASTLRARFGLRIDFLEEHIAFGLPTLSELQRLLAHAAPGCEPEIRYHANFRTGEAMLLDGVAARWGYDLRALARLIRCWFLTPRSTRLSRRPSPTTARVYAVVQIAE
jgi:hypothetical protein